MTCWQTLPFRINPYLIEFNGFGIRYYSLMYLVAFIMVYLVIKFRLSRESFPYDISTIQEFFTWAAFGVILGGRLGYVLIYNFSFYVSRPWEIFLPFDFSNGIRFVGITGMSFHGGLLGVALVFVIFCKKKKINIWSFSDLICPVIPLGYTFGRLGNFLNGELYGRPTSLPWGMIFPQDPAQTLRHPSQLYEACFEGLCLFFILMAMRKTPWAKNKMAGFYLIGYGVIRFCIEFVRQPDAHLSPLPWGMTMGQILCSLMVIAGTSLISYPRSSTKKSP
ncbi:MAG: prolipoprotein diacylglyceryl transferase [Desulfobacter sp.]|nr:prolipoprotein diacylglyceryl transferase [Desulfobacter sp.]WDP85995.1 MAG: prolipoprotein diacylglyceryl transferase [Desulfobacter sp.]